MFLYICFNIRKRHGSYSKLLRFVLPADPHLTIKSVGVYWIRQMLSQGKINSSENHSVFGCRNDNIIIIGLYVIITSIREQHDVHVFLVRFINENAVSLLLYQHSIMDHTHFLFQIYCVKKAIYFTVRFAYI